MRYRRASFLTFALTLLLSISYATPASAAPSKAAGVATAPAETAPAPDVASATNASARCGGGGHRKYYFSGRLKVRHNGHTKPLKGVQLRIVRKGSPLKWAQGPDAVTDANGKFQVMCTFARDRNGVAPWGKKIRFKIMARFRDSNFKVRKGGWFKNNWFKVARRNGCKRKGCKNFSFTLNGDEKAVSKTFDTSNLAGKHAYLWWFYNTLQDEMQKENVGLTNRPVFKRKLTITYPDRSVRQWFKKNFTNKSSNSWFMLNTHLAKGDWNNQETLIHEWMHRWDVEYTKGSASLLCIFDKHHKSPGKTGAAAKCSGFMEGFAEATAQALNQKHFGGNDPDLYTHWQLRTANADESYKVTNRVEAQRTDIGWQNFLNFLWKKNVWNGWGAAKTSWCTPEQVPVYEVLRALKRERPRKAKWLVSGNSTFKWFTDVLEKQVDDFSAEDATFYQLLGDPSLTASEIHKQTQGMDICGGPKTKKDPLAKKGGYQGRVFVRRADGSIGKKISNARITFTSEDGSITRKTTSGSNGSYRLALAPSRYRVKVTHPNYQNYDTGSGFFVVNEDEDFQTGNLFLNPSDGGDDPSDRNPASADFTGTWDTNFGELRLHQTGGYVIGDYADNGVIVGKTKGSCVAGVFTNGERNGIFRFNAAGSGNFEGQWAWQGDNLSGSWTGTRSPRASASPLQLQNFTRDGSTTQVIDNQRTVFDGTYRSPHGKIELFARDLFLIGDYADKGIIAGMWNGSSFVGHFTNGDRTGWFDFAFSSKNGSFRSGQWSWIGSSGGGSWSLSETSSQTPTPDNMLENVSCK